MEHCLKKPEMLFCLELTLERIKNGQVFIKNNFSKKKIIRDKWNKLSHTLIGTKFYQRQEKIRLQTY